MTTPAPRRGARAVLLRAICIVVLATLLEAGDAVPRVADGQLCDPQGRLLVLRGLNTGGASKHAPYLPWQQEADLDRLRPWGFNAVRLLVSWKAIEPSPGELNEAYADEVAKWVGWCTTRGVYVLVDFHQDLYAEAVGGNGAPDWAVLGSGEVEVPEGLPKGGPWYTAYFDPKVLSAFDAFWANAPVPATGRGVQDHYADAVAFLARRLRGQPCVLGYDLMNEPFYGSDVFKVFAAAVRHDPLFAMVGGLAMLGRNGSAVAARALRDEARTDVFFAGLEAPVRRFEEEKLMPFYDRVARAVRAADPGHVLFLEGTALKNGGGRSFLRRPRDAEGRPMENVAFAHHYYDASMADGTLEYDGRRSRVAWAVGRNLEEARSQGAAYLVGEYGALKSGVRGADRYLADYLDLFLETSTGSMYWSWEKDLTEKEYFGVFARPGALCVAGRDAKAGFDAATGRFWLEFDSDPDLDAPTEVFLPASVYPEWHLETTAGGTAQFEEASRTLTYTAATSGRVRIEVVPRPR